MRSIQPVTGSTRPLPAFPPAEPESLEQLLGDCRQMAARWHVPLDPGAADRRGQVPAGPRGITVSAESAHVVAGMAEFGD